jgi:hypothetical protein
MSHTIISKPSIGDAVANERAPVPAPQRATSRSAVRVYMSVSVLL